VVASRSTDAGLHWARSRPVIASTGTHAFSPALAASAGTVAVTAYRLRRGARADVLAALSADGGRSWRLRHVTPAFSLQNAPRAQAGQRFLGDYSGWRPVPGGGFRCGVCRWHRRWRGRGGRTSSSPASGRLSSGAGGAHRRGDRVYALGPVPARASGRRPIANAYSSSRAASAVVNKP